MCVIVVVLDVFVEGIVLLEQLVLGANLLNTRIQMQTLQKALFTAAVAREREFVASILDCVIPKTL